jgi:LuxR family maltose regulon positive regulatory protein
MIMKILGESQLQSGNLVKAKVSLNQAIEAGQAAGDFYQLIKAKSSLAHVYILEGRLQDALEMLKGALSQAGEITSQLCGNFPQIAYVYLQLAILYHEWYDLEKANKYIDLAYNSAIRLGNPGLMAKVCVTRAEIKNSFGDETSTDNLIKEAKIFAAQVDPAQETCHIPCYEAELYLRRSRSSNLDNWSRHFEKFEDGKFEFSDRACVLSYARFLSRNNRVHQSIELLQQFSLLCQESGSVLYAVRAHTALAIAFHKLGKQFDAMTNLEHAITLAYPNRLVKSIIASGNGIGELLNQAYQLNIRPEFVQELIIILRRTTSTETYNEFQELLSKREYQILKYLVTDLTVPEIADGLVLSTGTVRSHIKRIYRKLDVHRRKEAVDKAREMNLLVESNSIQWG